MGYFEKGEEEKQNAAGSIEANANSALWGRIQSAENSVLRSKDCEAKLTSQYEVRERERIKTDISLRCGITTRSIYIYSVPTSLSLRNTPRLWGRIPKCHIECTLMTSQVLNLVQCAFYRDKRILVCWSWSNTLGEEMNITCHNGENGERGLIDATRRSIAHPGSFVKRIFFCYWNNT